VSDLYRQALAWTGARLIAERKRRRKRPRKIELSGGRKITRPAKRR
jgi:hypothetical protein